MKSEDGLVFVAILLAILASINHVEKAINRQTDLLAHDIVGVQ